jgi:hypothetical protein
VRQRTGEGYREDESSRQRESERDERVTERAMGEKLCKEKTGRQKIVAINKRERDRGVVRERNGY